MLTILLLSYYEILGGIGNEFCLAMTLVSNSTAYYVDTIIFTCHILLITDEFCIWQLLCAHIATDEISLIWRGKVFTLEKSLVAITLWLSPGASSVSHCLREYGGSGWEEQWEQNCWYTCTQTRTQTTAYTTYTCLQCCL